jgi:hypothetical protein
MVDLSLAQSKDYGEQTRNEAKCGCYIVVGHDIAIRPSFYMPDMATRT